MYWFGRPPYLRWAAAGLLVLGALILELRGPSTVPHPYALHDLGPGSVVGDDDIEWNPVPEGVLPSVETSGATLSRPVRAGEPLLPSVLEPDPGSMIPEGWWASTVPLPAAVPPGTTVEVVVVPVDPASDPLVIPGLVLEGGAGDDPFRAAGPLGLVAVPGEAAPIVATAAAEGRVVVGLVGR